MRLTLIKRRGLSRGLVGATAIAAGVACWFFADHGARESRRTSSQNRTLARTPGQRPSPGRPYIPTQNGAPTKTRALFGREFQVLEEQDETTSTAGERLRVSLIDTGPEFGLVRIEAHFGKDAATGGEKPGRTDAFVAGDIIVTPAKNVSPETLEATLVRIGASSWTRLYGTERWLAHLRTPRIDSKPVALAAIKSLLPNLLGAEGNGVGSGGFAPDDAYFNSQYGLLNTGQTGGSYGADIQVTAAWNLATAIPNVVVAVLDSRIDFSHPDLQANVYADSREIAGNGVDDDRNNLVDDVHGWDFVNNDNSPDDHHNHGTHVSGILGACGNNGVGVAGVTWEAQIMPVKIRNSSNSGTTADLRGEAAGKSPRWRGVCLFQQRSGPDQTALLGRHRTVDFCEATGTWAFQLADRKWAKEAVIGTGGADHALSRNRSKRGLSKSVVRALKILDNSS